jgi:hypothetical protein
LLIEVTSDDSNVDVMTPRFGNAIKDDGQ